MIQQHGFAPSLRARLDADEMVFGLFLAEMRTPNFGLLLDGAGYDFAIFDLEHGAYTLADLASMLPGFRGGHCSPLVRVPAVRREWFQATLDLGAAGIVVPVVESPDDVRRAVELMKYPPQGKRGVAYCRPHCLFQSPQDEGFPARANEHAILVIQIETAAGLAHLDEILAVPGIDVVFVGNADLSQSLGCPNDLDRGPLCDAMERIVRAAAARGIPAGANLVDPKAIARLKAMGLRLVSLTTDVDRFLAGLQAAIQVRDGHSNPAFARVATAGSRGGRPGA